MVTPKESAKKKLITGKVTYYTACLVYADQDEGMAEVINSLYTRCYPKATFFRPQFDLKRGKYELGTTGTVIQDRCGGKAIFILSEYFFASDVCQFAVNFTAAVCQGAGTGNLVPFHLTSKSEHVPAVLKGTAGIRWFRKTTRRYSWQMMTDTIITQSMQQEEIAELYKRIEQLVDSDPSTYLAEAPYDKDTGPPGEPIKVIEPDGINEFLEKQSREFQQRLASPPVKENKTVVQKILYFIQKKIQKSLDSTDSSTSISGTPISDTPTNDTLTSTNDTPISDAPSSDTPNSEISNSDTPNSNTPINESLTSATRISDTSTLTSDSSSGGTCGDADTTVLYQRVQDSTKETTGTSLSSGGKSGGKPKGVWRYLKKRFSPRSPSQSSERSPNVVIDMETVTTEKAAEKSPEEFEIVDAPQISERKLIEDLSGIKVVLDDSCRFEISPGLSKIHLQKHSLDSWDLNINNPDDSADVNHPLDKSIASVGSSNPRERGNSERHDVQRVCAEHAYGFNSHGFSSVNYFPDSNVEVKPLSDGGHESINYIVPAETGVSVESNRNVPREEFAKAACCAFNTNGCDQKLVNNIHALHSCNHIKKPNSDPWIDENIAETSSDIGISDAVRGVESLQSDERSDSSEHNGSGSGRRHSKNVRRYPDEHDEQYV